MLYIKKTQPPQALQDWIDDRKNAGQALEYSSLDKNTARELRNQLYEEQKGLCCYCMKTITKDNSNIEHFLPQSIFKENEVDYYNLYLACRYSKGISKEQQHCDIAKGNDLIAKYIGYLHQDNQGNIKLCQDFIQYTEDGYILPKKEGFKTLNKFYKQYQELNAQEKELLGTIEVLNLNCESLVNERNKFINETPNIRGTVNNISDIDGLQISLENYKNGKQKFKGVAIFFIQKRIKELSNS